MARLSKTITNSDTITSLKALSTEHLKPCLSLVIGETAEHLFTLSTSSRLAPDNQEACYRAFTTLQRASRSVVAEISAAVSQKFEEYTIDNNAFVDNGDGDGDGRVITEARLALIPLEEFEDTLAIEKIVRSGTERFWLDLESLMLRLAHVLGVEASTIELPVSPRTICSAYRQALQTIGFPRAFLVDADSAFARNLLPELEPIYNILNAHLESLGLLPDVREVLGKSGSQILIPQSSSSDHHRTQASELDTNSQNASDPVSAEDQSAMSEQRRKDMAAAASLSAAGHPLLHSSDWVNSVAIDTLSGHVSPVTRQAPAPQLPPDVFLTASGGRGEFVPSRLSPPARDEAARNRLLTGTHNLLFTNPPSTLDIEAESLRITRELARLRREGIDVRYTADSIIEAIGFTPKAAIYDRLIEAVKISAGLFDHVFDRIAPPVGMQSPFYGLELCFLELSLSDLDFLIDGDHPGRLLVDRIADLVTLLPRGRERYLHDFIEIVSQVVARFDGTLVSLVWASDALSDLSTKLISQQRLNRDRLIAKENAADRIDTARLSVLNSIIANAGDGPQPRHLIDTISSGLFDQWVVDTLKGAEPRHFEEALSVLIRFAGSSSQEPDLSITKADIMAVFIDAALQRPAIEAAIETCASARTTSPAELVTAPYNWGADIDLLPTELSVCVKGRPRLARKVSAVQKLELDTWFLEARAAHSRYLQVVWVNRHNTRFVLSDERGVKQRDVSVLQMAAEFGRLLRPLSTLERLSLVEQTLFSKLSDTKNDLSAQFLNGIDGVASTLLHEIERAMRRARRAGVHESAISFSIGSEINKDTLADALTRDGLSVRAIEAPFANKACVVVTSTDTAHIVESVARVLAVESVIDVCIEPIDPVTEPSAQAVIDRITGDVSASISNSPVPDDRRTVTPKTLHAAIEEAFLRLESVTGDIRLQSIVRVPVDRPDSAEHAYLMTRHNPFEKGQEVRQQFHQRDIRIATNFVELAEACRILAKIERLTDLPPHIFVRLMPETCLHSAALDRILTLISEHTVGTSQLSFLIADSMQIRESVACHRLTNALRSIGCHIVLEEYNPARSNSESINQLHATDLVLEANFWEKAAQNEPWSHVLPQIITDVHHILGQTISVRDPSITQRIEDSGIDFVERHSSVALSPAQLLTSYER